MSLISGLILDKSNLYVVDPAYFPDNMEAFHVEVADEIDSTTLFAWMVDVVEETEETEAERNLRINTDWWYRLYSRQVLPDVDSIRAMRRLAWYNWAWTYDIMSQTPLPRVTNEL